MFEEKEKEPLLSDEVKKIIERSTGEKTLDNTDEIIRFKYKIMQVLTSNKDILNTLHYKDGINLNGDKLRDVCIFDYMHTPDFKDDIKNFICFDIIDRPSVNYNVEKQITFRLVCHKDEMKTDWGVSRTDLLACILKNCFDWTNSFGLTWTKIYDAGIVGDKDYYYREIVYSATSPNNIYKRINK